MFLCQGFRGELKSIKSNYNDFAKIKSWNCIKKH